MKNTFVAGIVVLAFQLVTMSETRAQGTLYLSNLGEPSLGAVSVGADSWMAQAFGSGGDPRGYRLNSIQLLMSGTVGSPTGFSISIYDGANRNEGPGNFIESLSGVAPTSGGIFTYSASDVMLSPLTTYWIVITSGTPVTGGAYLWNLAGTTGYYSSGGWAGVRPSYDSSVEGLVWTRNGNTPLQFAVYATPIPEPSSLALFGLGVFFCAAHLLRMRRSKQ